MHRSLVIIIVLGLMGGLAPLTARGQGRTTRSASPPNVYLDCRAECDADLIRSEITYVNWVRDRTVADVHVLITSESTGADGDAYTFAFLGQRALAGRGDTLVYTSAPTQTSDERRRAVAHTLALGLVQFAARTVAASEIQIVPRQTDAAEADRQTTPAQDPWRAWVFELSVDASTDGERSYHSVETREEIEASRITPAWKTDLDLEYSYEDEKTEVQDFDEQGQVTGSRTFTNVQRDWDAELLMVKSLGAHWSAGFRGSIESNTFRNQKRRMQFTPAVEFDLYPYAEATRRQLAIQYGVGFDALVYADTTIFDKLRETLPMHYLSVDYATKQPWGSIRVGVEHRNYLNDASKRNTQIDGEVEVRLFQGFSVDFGGGYSWIRDQLYLPKGHREAAEVLLRKQQLLTGFEYDFRFGISYTFGSIFNNVVNPRF